MWEDFIKTISLVQMTLTEVHQLLCHFNFHCFLPLNPSNIELKHFCVKTWICSTIPFLWKTLLLMFLPILLSIKIHMKCWWWCSVISDCFVIPWTVVHHAPLSMGISQARILDRVAISFSRRSSRASARTLVSCTAGGFFTTEPPGKPIYGDIYNKVHSRVDIDR